MAYEYLTNPEQSKKTLIHIINSRVSKAHPQIQTVYLKKQSSILREYANSILADCNHVDQHMIIGYIPIPQAKISPKQSQRLPLLA